MAARCLDSVHGHTTEQENPGMVAHTKDVFTGARELQEPYLHITEETMEQRKQRA